MRRHCKTGSYVGDGSTSKVISGIGFRPKYVKIWVQRIDGGEDAPIHETTDTIIDDHASGMSMLHSTTANHHVSKKNAIIGLSNDGFTVDDNGLDEHPNKDLQVYNYMALK